jgi:hypothetical protein
MPLFFTFLFIFNTIHYLTHYIMALYERNRWFYTVLFTPHEVAVMRLGQAGSMHGSGAVVF